MKKRFWLLLATITLCCVSAFAHNKPDHEREGSIRVTMACEGATVPGGTLTLYRVGDVQKEAEAYSFRLTKEFAQSDTSLENLNAALAQSLKNYATEQALTGQTEPISQEGHVAFSELTAGLYLLVQEEAASGYYRTEPFLVTLPVNGNGTYIYDVDASPKVEVEEKPSHPDKPTPPPEVPVEPPRSEEPQTPPGSADTSDTPKIPGTPTTEILETSPPLTDGLPQTGQLNWPVPVLAVLGMALLAMGVFVKRSGYEK